MMGTAHFLLWMQPLRGLFQWEASAGVIFQEKTLKACSINEGQTIFQKVTKTCVQGARKQESWNTVGVRVGRAEL